MEVKVKMSEESVTTEKQVSLSDLQSVESGSSVDLNKFHKTGAEIEGVDIIQVPSTYTKSGKQWVLKVYSKVLETIEKEDGTKVDFRASELFNLIQDKEGKLKGYPESQDSNLKKFMADLRIEKPDQIVGKKATIKAYDKEVEGKPKTYLKFMY